MTNNMTISIIAIQKWNFYCYNFEHNFIQKVWGNDTLLADHLQEKFNALYQHYGAMGVMPSFYAELDSNNKVKLLTYILENYNDEQKLGCLD